MELRSEPLLPEMPSIFPWLKGCIPLNGTERTPAVAWRPEGKKASAANELAANTEGAIISEQHLREITLRK